MFSADVGEVDLYNVYIKSEEEAVGSVVLSKIDAVGD
jgi:hypothetical protein